MIIVYANILKKLDTQNRITEFWVFIYKKDMDTLLKIFNFIISKCEFDKLLHNKAGNYFGALICVMFLTLDINVYISAFSAWVFATLIGIMKDYVFDVYIQHEKADIYDVIATSIGGFEIFVFASIVGKIIELQLFANSTANNTKKKWPPDFSDSLIFLIFFS